MTFERSAVPLIPSVGPRAEPGRRARGGSAVLGAGTSALSLTCTPAATTDARHWTSAQLRAHGLQSPDVCEDAELIVSELVSNAVLHGRAPIVVTLTDTADELVVAVADAGAPPYLFGSRPADPTASHGRGLAIVASLAFSWGIRASHPGPGKTVWGSLRSAVSADAL